MSIFVVSDDVQLGRGLARFDPISIDGLDERAALLRRVDRKYVVGRQGLVELVERLREGHLLLSIDGRRTFDYRSVYFDTPDRRCFVDHVADRTPRFKARTRLYRDTGTCVFEVKLKRSDGEMDKRQVEHPSDRGDELTEGDLQCVGEALSDAGLERPRRLDPTLVTSFTRITFAARERPERLTCDLRVSLFRLDGPVARIRDGLVVVETKTEDGQSPADRALEEAGAERISLSKYRVGIGLVGDAPIEDTQPAAGLFEVTGR